MTGTFSPKHYLNSRDPDQLHFGKDSRQGKRQYISSKGKCIDIVAYCQSQNSQRSNKTNATSSQGPRIQKSMMGNIEAKIKKTFKKPLTRKATNSTNGEISSFSMGKKSTNDAQRVDAVTAKHMLNFSMVSSASRGSKSFNKQALQVVQKV